jgi:quinol monooxygenase YgiN
MKQILTNFTCIAMLAFASCNSGTEQTATAPTDTAAATAVAETPAFEPFKVIAVSHTVKDFDVFKKVYDEHESMRTESGITRLTLGRDADNPNKVYVFNKIADLQKARDFAASPALKAAMEKAGVTGAPTINFAEVLRFDEATASMKDRVRIAHKVKDFDAWLKVYDTEGKETRASHGVVDRALSRDIDDPSMVYVSFAISDMTKAKARLNDPALKALMMEAGVIGEPVISFFTVVE